MQKYFHFVWCQKISFKDNFFWVNKIYIYTYTSQEAYKTVAIFYASVVAWCTEVTLYCQIVGAPLSPSGASGTPLVCVCACACACVEEEEEPRVGPCGRHQLSSSKSVSLQRAGRWETFLRENLRHRSSPTSFRWCRTWATQDLINTHHLSSLGLIVYC